MATITITAEYDEDEFEFAPDVVPALMALGFYDIGVQE